ncbi:MAG: hypothetical protein V3U29_09385 [Phycisphaeraceae bacterium]
MLVNIVRYGAVLVCVTVLIGCESPPLAVGNDTAYYAGRPRSLVLDSRRMRQADSQADRGGLLPWYAYRNDARLTATVGYDGGTIEHSTTLTYDRQRSHGGRIHDDFYETTYRIRHSSTAR